VTGRVRSEKRSDARRRSIVWMVGDEAVLEVIQELVVTEPMLSFGNDAAISLELMAEFAQAVRDASEIMGDWDKSTGKYHWEAQP